MSDHYLAPVPPFKLIVKVIGWRNSRPRLDLGVIDTTPAYVEELLGYGEALDELKSRLPNTREVQATDGALHAFVSEHGSYGADYDQALEKVDSHHPINPLYSWPAPTSAPDADEEVLSRDAHVSIFYDKRGALSFMWTMDPRFYGELQSNPVPVSDLLWYMLATVPGPDVPKWFARLASESPYRALSIAEEGLAVPEQKLGMRSIFPLLTQKSLLPLLGHEEREVRARAGLLLGRLKHATPRSR